ncbi:MAG TPA: pyridoxine 5'-phosphate synthase [Bacteroidales bacterium]|nr:MAG: pyridoxine 5'-phosphate synthase [Bacteroidetes bacterium GWE2_42_24]OFY31048.1 MAG: pyridoxine 5'-phosphate synthase [Bacteroidetes bacterium GWF2_43_11]PKP23463.1 MAG: pyridoxine 5'-phosphate synthase [Bacteroidetes bacterium HGW-Bacteroidetes-22]HAQ64638.1 pyridoxine 5'-phosphate synthase [Bacteroidales bacterium]HBZ66582.1 pyridoxine 5'-phosphate synthase [Bacteroidales bacterium]
MTRLSVNINKIATLRNARGGNVPNVQQVGVDCQRFGAQGITVHPRPDERHIRYEDVRLLRPLVLTEFNIEGYPNREFIDLVLSVMPEQVTLVPDPPDALTSNAGWDTIAHESFLREVISEFRQHGIRTSVFVGTDLKLVAHAARCGTDRVELYTEPYAIEYPTDHAAAIAPFARAAQVAVDNGLGINAGHDLNLVNLQYFAKGIPSLAEVSIGHALIADALYYGLENTVQMYLNCLR